MRKAWTILWLGAWVLGMEPVAAQKNQANSDEALAGEPALPEPVRMADGSAVSTAEAWREQRRAEVLALFREHVYGRTPEREGKLSFETVSVEPHALDGQAVRKQVRIRLTEHPEWEGIDLMLWLPRERSGPVPCFVGLSFGGNHAVSAEPDIPLSTRWMRDSREKGHVGNRATEASRGNESSRWPLRAVVERGYAVATAYYGDIEPDHPEGWKDGVRAVLSPQGRETVWGESEWGGIGAWAWGLSRMLDYLEIDPDIDATRCAVIGHSRLGKTSLWAGAQDERFALVISNNSGEGGAALMRRNFGETTEIITRNFPHWFAPKYRSYAANPDACPVDQHLLVALAAPRPVYVASASEDWWADPKGEFLSARHAGLVYGLFGLTGVGREEPPPADTPVGEFIGYHLRTGKHDVTLYDWERYLDFADRHGLGGR